MNIILTAFGELLWTSTCGIINFCITSGVSCLIIFISLLCTIATSSFYCWTKMRDKRGQTSLENNTEIFNVEEPPMQQQQVEEQTDDNEPIIADNEDLIDVNEPVVVDDEELIDEINNNIDVVEPDNNIQINESTIESDIIIDTIEGTEEEIQQKQIQNIYRLLNQQNLTSTWSATDFVEQLRMYGLYGEFELPEEELAV
ncbi:unnamed protein product [Didymodactylos carnosus]|uniref:Transmembrane protein n=2 Tax=Didymodactylos carnosus TaxID=1234261 RepID=A0A8S2RFH2_9BILA|nr:unnamed protein product [Didymodactylos carnosus]CAF4157475.1 unnamed protein product [Didymodactylos carnosus]